MIRADSGREQHTVPLVARASAVLRISGKAESQSLHGRVDGRSFEVHRRRVTEESGAQETPEAWKEVLALAKFMLQSMAGC